MNLEPGSSLGPYEILGPHQAGGLGQAYEARDTRTGHVVAVKVLPGDLAGDPDLLARAEREARAVAALDHPALPGILAFENQGGRTFIVTELLEGETLTTRLAHGAMPERLVSEWAVQIAAGLAAAHGQGILHLALNPDELWLTPDGRIRILDFGLAGHAAPAPPRSGAHRPEAGEVPGALAYLSPEQVRGQAVDARSDLFSLGAVLFEMVTGVKAFARHSAEETRAAVLHGEPLQEGQGRPVPPALEEVLDLCLRKDPIERYPDALELGAVLDTVAASLRPSPLRAPFASWSPGLKALGAALGIGLLLAAGFIGWRLQRQPWAPAKLHMLNFPVGTIESARFGADGVTVYCSLRVVGGPPELYSFDPRETEPKALGLHDALLLAISPSNDLAIIQNPYHVLENQYIGTLAQVSGRGGAQRVVREGVAEVAWGGAGMAMVMGDAAFRDHLEFPVGRTLETWDASTRSLSHITLSGDGNLLACVDRDEVEGVTTLVAYRREGGRRVLYTQEGDGSGGSITGLVWGPRGELWVSEAGRDQTEVWTLSPRGVRRVLWHSQGNLQLLDVSREGRALLVQQTIRRSVCGVKAGTTSLVDLSIQGRTQVRGISDDGRLVLLNESPVTDGGTVLDRCYLRPLDGGPPRPLGKGFGWSLSGDGRWAQVDTGPQPARDLDPAWAQALWKADLANGELEDTKGRTRLLLFAPTGQGSPFAVALPKGYEPSDGVAFLLPDGQRAAAVAKIDGRDGWVLLDRRGGPPIPVTPPGSDWLLLASLDPLSPDGTRLIISPDSKSFFIQPILGGGQPQPVRGLRPDERLVGWSAEGDAVYVRSGRSRLPVTVSRLDLNTGARRVVASFSPLDPAGFLECRDVFTTPDGRASVFSYQKRMSDLYLADNLAGGS